MAVWQFKFYLVPVKGIVKVHGKVVPRLSEYAPFNPESSFEEIEARAAQAPNYWEQAGVSPASMEGLTTMLPPIRSWSEEAKMFGDGEDGGAKIEIWKDDIQCKLDLRVFSEELLVAIVDEAADAECMLVLQETGEVIEPDLPLVLDKILESNAYAFCTGPTEFLRKLADRRR